MTDTLAKDRAAKFQAPERNLQDPPRDTDGPSVPAAGGPEEARGTAEYGIIGCTPALAFGLLLEW